MYRMSLRQLRVDQRRGPKPACPNALRRVLITVIKHGSTTGYQAGVSEQGASLRRLDRTIRTSLMMRSFRMYYESLITSVIRTYSLLALLFATTTVQRSTVSSHHVVRRRMMWLK